PNRHFVLVGRLRGLLQRHLHVIDVKRVPRIGQWQVAGVTRDQGPVSKAVGGTGEAIAVHWHVIGHWGVSVCKQSNSVSPKCSFPPGSFVAAVPVVPSPTK